MPLFTINKKDMSLVKPTNFKLEKELQTLIEGNLETVFNCKFVATEFSTGAEHAGRIDSLALSEDNNPVIIEYKKEESSQLINQSLFYLSWISDHRGDFEIAAQKALGNDVDVDWSDIRVICIAPAYKKYDIHAAKMMGANIELWQYRLYDDHHMYLEEVFRKTSGLMRSVGADGAGKNPVMVEAGKKAALTRATGIYNFDQHLEKADEKTKELVLSLQEYILSLDDSIEEAPKKFYVAYKIAQNFVCMETQKRKVILYLKLNPDEVEMPANGRDMRGRGHYGTGDFELTIKNKNDVEFAMSFIKASYERLGE